MSYIILAILFFISGFFMKYSDDLYDVNHNIIYASVFGVVCGLASALAAVSDAGAAYLFLAILIGNLFVLKVDGVHHIIALIVFIVGFLIGGIPANLSLVVLLICVLAAMCDEVGHETIHKFTDVRYINLFFEYRFVMKIVVLLLALSGVFSIWLFLCFIIFDIAYVFSGMIFEKLN